MPNAAPRVRGACPCVCLGRGARQLHKRGLHGTGHGLPGSHALLLSTPRLATSLTPRAESRQTGPNAPSASTWGLRQLAERLTQQDRDEPWREKSQPATQKFSLGKFRSGNTPPHQPHQGQSPHSQKTLITGERIPKGWTSGHKGKKGSDSSMYAPRQELPEWGLSHPHVPTGLTQAQSWTTQMEQGTEWDGA